MQTENTVTGQELNGVGLLASILSEAAKPRFDLSQVYRLSVEVWPQGLDNLVDSLSLSCQQDQCVPDQQSA